MASLAPTPHAAGTRPALRARVAPRAARAQVRVVPPSQRRAAGPPSQARRTVQVVAGAARVMIAGAPGCGKGTQCEGIVRKVRSSGCTGRQALRGASDVVVGWRALPGPSESRGSAAGRLACSQTRAATEGRPGKGSRAVARAVARAAPRQVAASRHARTTVMPSGQRRGTLSAVRRAPATSSQSFLTPDLPEHPPLPPQHHPSIANP